MPAIFLFLSSIVGPLAAKILTSLGLGAVTYIGITALLTTVRMYLINNVGGVPADIAMLFGLLKVDIAINIMLSAVTARAVIAGMNKTTGKKTGIGTVSS